MLLHFVQNGSSKRMGGLLQNGPLSSPGTLCTEWILKNNGWVAPKWPSLELGPERGPFWSTHHTLLAKAELSRVCFVVVCFTFSGSSKLKHLSLKDPTCSNILGPRACKHMFFVFHFLGKVDVRAKLRAKLRANFFATGLFCSTGEILW